MNSQKLKELTDRMISRLKKEGFVVQYYGAISTDSHYLKLDYGVCNSIRISDHPGKGHLQYRYNLILGLKKYKRTKTQQGWDRFFYPASDMEALVRHIVATKQRKLKTNGGTEGYTIAMEKMAADNEGKAGFWSSSVLV